LKFRTLQFLLRRRIIFEFSFLSFEGTINLGVTNRIYRFWKNTCLRTRPRMIELSLPVAIDLIIPLCYIISIVIKTWKIFYTLIKEISHFSAQIFDIFFEIIAILTLSLTDYCQLWGLSLVWNIRLSSEVLLIRKLARVLVFVGRFINIFINDQFSMRWRENILICSLFNVCRSSLGK